MTTLDFFVEKLNIDKDKKLVIFDDKDKENFKTELKFSNGEVIERRKCFGIV